MIDPKDLNETVENLVKNNFIVKVFQDSITAKKEIINDLKGAKSISRGGSMTLDSIGIIKEIIEKELPFRDYISPEDRIASLTADYYLTGTNAITKEGKLINVDGCGNRISAISYGPNKVLVVAGVNKIVKNEKKAFERINNIAAPLNAKRLKRNTPCVKTGKCENCMSPERICRKTLIVNKADKDRITIYIIKEKLGY